MSSKKTDVIWFRFKFTDDVKTRAAVIRAADKLFKLQGVIERRSYTEEEVADMMKRAIQEAGVSTCTNEVRSASLADGRTNRTDKTNTAERRNQ